MPLPTAQLPELPKTRSLVDYSTPFLFASPVLFSNLPPNPSPEAPARQPQPQIGEHRPLTRRRTPASDLRRTPAVDLSALSSRLRPRSSNTGVAPCFLFPANTGVICLGFPASFLFGCRSPRLAFFSCHGKCPSPQYASL